MPLCAHLRPLEQELIARGIREDDRSDLSGQVREWVYFYCVLDLPALRARLQLDPVVEDVVHLGTHDGQEQGFACRVHRDGIMGVHPAVHPSAHHPPPLIR